jgi:hypothetical protein
MTGNGFAPLRRRARGLAAVLMLLMPPYAAAEEAVSTQAELGPVRVDVRLAPADPLIGDPVELTVTVTAEKDVEVLMPEFGEALDEYTILDFVPRQQLDSEGRTVQTQKYRLQPPFSGTQAIPPILVEFVDRRPGQRAAPEGLDAYELLTDRLEFQVQSVLPQAAEAELKPPLGELEPLAAPPRPRWPWLAAGLAVLAIAAPFLVKAVLAWRRRARKRSAYEVARGRLERLLSRPFPSGDQVDPFFVELSAIVRRYLEDRFELRAPELTTEEFLAAVGSPSPHVMSTSSGAGKAAAGRARARKARDATASTLPVSSGSGDATALSREHQSLLQEFLKQADLVKFAGVRPGRDDIQRSIDATRRFLEETRDAAPLIDVPVDEPSRTDDPQPPRQEVPGA